MFALAALKRSLTGIESDMSGLFELDILQGDRAQRRCVLVEKLRLTCMHV